MAAWRNLGRALRTSNFNTIDCRPVLRRLTGAASGRKRSRREVARSIHTIFEAMEERRMMSTTPVLPAPSNITQVVNGGNVATGTGNVGMTSDNNQGTATYDTAP